MPSAISLIGRSETGADEFDATLKTLPGNLPGTLQVNWQQLEAIPPLLETRITHSFEELKATDSN